MRVGENVLLLGQARAAGVDDSNGLAGDADGLVCSQRSCEGLIGRDIAQLRLREGGREGGREEYSAIIITVRLHRRVTLCTPYRQ